MAVTLASGSALCCLGQALYERRLRLGAGALLLAAALAGLLIVPLGLGLNALAELAGLLAVLVALCVVRVFGAAPVGPGAHWRSAARERIQPQMLSTFLVEHAALVPVAFWVGVALTAAAGLFVERRGHRRLLVVLGATSLIGAMLLVFVPTSTPPALRFCAVQLSVPFTGIDTLANVALLLPLTVFVGLLTRRPVVVLASVSGLSAVVELVQGLAPQLGRACDTNDWFMNTVGAVVGAAIAAAVLALGRRGRAQSSGSS